jgi:hypothetical protein
MNAEKKEMIDWLKDLIDCLYNERKMSKAEVELVFKKANTVFYNMFHQTVYQALDNPKLKTAIESNSILPAEHIVTQIYYSVVCEVIWG